MKENDFDNKYPQGLTAMRFIGGDWIEIDVTREIKEIISDSRKLRIESEGGRKIELCSGKFICGSAYGGMDFTVLGDKGGGVIKLDDLVKLRDFINKHLENILNDKY